MPEIRLENRYLEQDPSNLREKTALLSRPGTTPLATFGNGPIRGTYSKDGLMSSDLFVVSGPSLFRYNTAGTKTQITGTIFGSGNPSIAWMKGIGYERLFIADSLALQYYDGGSHAVGTLTLSGGSITNQVITIDGVYYTWSNVGGFSVNDNGTSSHPWKALLGASDAVSLQNMANLLNFAGVPGVNFSPGLTAPAAHVTATAPQASATGTFTLAGGPITNQVIQVGTIWYTWSAAVDDNTPNGTSSTPYKAALGSTDAQSLANMAKLLNFTGTPGVDFSSAIVGPNPYVTATSTATTLVVTASTAGTVGNSVATAVFSGAFLTVGAATLAGGGAATTLVVTSNSVYADGNAITTTVVSGSFLAWGGGTLSGGNVHALKSVAYPGQFGPLALASVSSYLLASEAGTQIFYWLNPGAVVIDPLDFASKESNPDNILDMVTVGDQVVICGNGSTENWYASGNFDAPFLPIEGRVYQRGAIQGTLVRVKDSVVLIADDMIVYAIGYQFGNTAQWGVHRISDHGIEERIRTELRSEDGDPA